MRTDPARLRREYETAGLHESDLAPDPITQFHTWFDAAVDAGLELPNTMVLATVGSDGRPSARAVLFKGVDRDGFTFYTSYRSRKAGDLASNPYAALCFVWLPLHRQVRVEGTVTRVADAEADQYFATRPRGAQIAAVASDQSQIVADRATLEAEFAAVERRYGGDPIPRPDHWGGYRLRPDLVEFWQGRANRYHDRLVYLRGRKGWHTERLAP